MKKSNTSNKMSKKDFIVSILCIFIGAVIGICGTLITQDIIIALEDNVELTSAEIFAKSRAAVLDYKYAKCTLNVVNLVNEEEEQFQYTMAACRDSHEKNLEVGNFADDEYLSYVWRYSEANEKFEVFGYQQEEECWVQEFSSNEPMTIELYDILKNAERYTLLDEKHISEEYGECYVFQIIAQSDEYDELSEHIYISCDTFLPKCIVTQGITYTDSDEVKEGNVTQEVQYYDESIARYVFEYSNESLFFLEFPESYITAEEWAVYEESKKSETSTENVVDDEESVEENEEH